MSSIKPILAIMKILPPPIGCTHTAYQPGTLSSKYLEHMPYRAQQNIPEPEKFGWILLEHAWKPVWTLLPEVARACQELLKCDCKSLPFCSKKCKCRDAGLSCTGLCYCGGTSGVDPGFEIGGCPKCARKHAKVFFFQCHTHFQVHNQVWAPWNCDTIITIGINKHEVVENYNFEAFCGHCCIKALPFKHKNFKLISGLGGGGALPPPPRPSPWIQP